VIEARQNRIQRDLDQAAELKAQTEQALANYEQALIEARGRAHAVARDMRDKLAAEIDNERAKFDARIARKLADADARITQTRSKALANVGDIAADAAAAVVAKLIGVQVR
jgi:F-type H+-transporting ATPase subunit b